jgi:hypothetical protein
MPNVAMSLQLGCLSAFSLTMLRMLQYFMQYALKWGYMTYNKSFRSGIKMHLQFESQEGQEFPRLHVVCTGSGNPLASYTMGTGREAGYSLQTSAKGQEYVELYWHYFLCIQPF